MQDNRFFATPAPLRLAEVAELVGAELVRGDPAALIRGAAALDGAGEGDISFFENRRYLKQLGETGATACLCPGRYVERVPARVAVLATPEPYRVYAVYLAHAYPGAMRPSGSFGDLSDGLRQGVVHPDARLEEDVCIEPGALIGARAEIGRGTIIAAGAVIGPGVAIGRECFVGASATIQFALLGNRVIVHPGVRIGQDGFGFALGPGGHLKVAQIGRVIVQDDVEIGANTTIDRGANRDTIIGEGTKIDKQVQIGHNAEIGRHCIIVAQVGIAGSARIGDFVVIGGQTGVSGHIRIGDGARIAGVSFVHGNVPAGARWGGAPARQLEEWFREIGALRRLARRAAPHARTAASRAEAGAADGS
jgi:UDP-3-O-[3-hydroxymyristoyl] glucosamine N-acyltransferase